VKDFFTGFFLLAEDQIRQGDVVKLGDHAGLVEQVTLRYVQLRDYDGHLHFVPNGSITSVVNMARGHAQAVVEVGVAYSMDVDAAMATMQAVAAEMRRDPDQAARILGDLEMAGVERWADSAAVIRARFEVAPLKQWNVRREYLRRLKNAFDRAGIEIPFPQPTLHRPARRPTAGTQSPPIVKMSAPACRPDPARRRGPIHLPVTRIAMRTRTLFGLLFIVLIVAFAILNWPAFIASTALSAGFFSFEAPLGLTMLCAMGVITLGFVVNMAMWQGSVLLETRRHTKELHTQRALADQAEASRFNELRGALHLEFETLAQRIAQSREKDRKFDRMRPRMAPKGVLKSRTFPDVAS